mgnify:CR=1 FL=1
MDAWESAEMVRRYAHLAPEQFAQHARVVDDVFNGTNLTQSILRSVIFKTVSKFNCKSWLAIIDTMKPW